jgi:hypothetical protein
MEDIREADDVAPPSAPVAPKSERKPEKRDRKMTLTRVSRRGRFGRRVFELQAIWGEKAASLTWTPGDLFDLTAGLAWRFRRVRVEAIAPDRARLGDGRTIRRPNDTICSGRVPK